MDFPPSQVCPRRPLTPEVKREAEPYAHKLAIRGLYDESLRLKNSEKYIANCPSPLGEGYISNCPSFYKRLNSHDVSSLSLSARVEYCRLLKTHTCGLHGEIAFNIYRGLNYHNNAFEVANSYIYHNTEDTETGEVWYPYIYPDACLDASCSVLNYCSGSVKIDVKCQSHRACNEELGLDVLNYRSGRRILYVAVSEHSEHNVSYDENGKTFYRVIDYAILGYAFECELDKVAPTKKGWSHIHFYKLHPIDCLTPSDYETSETVYDRMKKLGCV